LVPPPRWVYTGASALRGYSADEQFVDIRAGTGTRAIGERLVEPASFATS
jgi:hypothetical protein